jgi:hypothetical protein
MLVAESVLVITLLCSTAKRRQTISSPSDGSHAIGQLQPVQHLSVVQRLSGRTLESDMVNEIEKMPGVVSVSAKRTGDTFDISVSMDTMEFEPFDRVVNYKLALYELHPGYVFNFDYQLADLPPTIAIHAA